MRGSTGPLSILLSLVAVATLAAGAPGAADTGSVSGAVFDQDGQPVADAPVRISGDTLPGGRIARTGANGIYQFEYLLPGEYAVEADRAGAGRAHRAAIVEVGRDTQVDLVIGLEVNEELTVTAARPIVDARSTEVSFNFTTETFTTLPLERTYRGLLQLVPGVADNRSSIGAPAGGSRQDNTYLIDGANITSPGFGTLSTEINELDIAEVNLKRGGISAEFGRTSGAVTNAVSRSGTNTVAGIGRIDWLSKELVGAYQLPDDVLATGVRPGAFRDPLLATEAGPAFGLGGPILPNHVFFYGSARYSQQTKWGRINKVNTPLPDELRSGPEFYGKITATPTMAHQITGSYRYRPYRVENGSITSDFAPSVATTADDSNRIATAEWANFLTDRSSFNLRYLYSAETNEDEPVTDLGYLPPFNPGKLSEMGQYADASQANLTVGGYGFANTQNYRRHEVRGVFSRYFDLGGSSHGLKAGAGYEFAEETFNRLANGWGSIANVNVSGVPALRARYYTRQAPQLGAGRTYSVFVQDDVTVGRRTTVNAGVLFNRDDFSQNVDGSGGCPATVVLKGGAAIYASHGDTCNFLRFGFGDEIQPRLGISYQVRDAVADKAYAHWGRYYSMDQKSTARSLAPSRIFQTDTVFDLTGRILSSGPLASTTGKMIDPAIKPTYNDEVLFGYATPLGGSYSLDVFFLSRSIHNVIEDLPSRLNGTAPNSGPFVAANLPCAAYVVCQTANARRTYRALTADLRRQLTNRWMSDISYTWSRFEGNFDLDFATVAVFNTSSLIQDGPGTNVQDPNRQGPLFEDRPHILKVFTTYAAKGLTASGYLRVQSGTPWAARGRDWPGAALNYLEPAGSHRNPVWTNLDLMGAYRLPIKGPAVSIEARLLNVFDNQTQLSTDAQQYLDLRMIQQPPYIAPYQQPNPFFATGNAFAPPRRLHFAAVVSF